MKILVASNFGVPAAASGLPAPLAQLLADAPPVDAVVIAGNLGDPRLRAHFTALGPVTQVGGLEDWEELPASATLKVGSYAVHVLPEHLQPRPELRDALAEMSDCQLVVVGGNEFEFVPGETAWLCPGSATGSGGGAATVCVVDVDDAGRGSVYAYAYDAASDSLSLKRHPLNATSAMFSGAAQPEGIES